MIINYGNKFGIRNIQCEILNYNNFKDKNACFLELWFQTCRALNLANCGLTVLPFTFWKEIGISYRKDWRRFYFGCGLFSFFISFLKK